MPPQFCRYVTAAVVPSLPLYGKVKVTVVMLTSENVQKEYALRTASCGKTTSEHGAKVKILWL